MTDRQQQQRERAYRLWEDEGRPEGAHEDHWRRAGEDADDVTEVNQEMDRAFDGDRDTPENAADIRPPSSVAPD